MIEHMFDTMTAPSETESDTAINPQHDGADHQIEGIPAGLDEMEPGPILAIFLSGINVDRLSGAEKVVVLRAQHRMASHYAATSYRTMAAIVDNVIEEEDTPAHLAAEAAAAEIGAALHLTRRSADIELSHALDLRQRLPQVWMMLATGRIDPRRAKTLMAGTDHLTVAQARDVADHIRHEAPHMTTGQIGAQLRRTCIEIEPDDARHRYDQAVADRRVITESNATGTADLHAYSFPPQRLAAATRHLNRIARAMRTAGETRTMDQLRADAFLDLLEGKNPMGSRPVPRDRRGTVDIHVGLATLAGLSESPGDLAGYGPVIADIARQVVAAQTDAEWRITVTDEATDTAVFSGITRSRPTAAQRREAQSRDHTCVWLGCRMPAVESDLDHRVPLADRGPTNVANLAPLCRHHHVIRHRWGWTYRRLHNGDHEWTSPLGRTYLSRRRPP